MRERLHWVPELFWRWYHRYEALESAAEIPKWVRRFWLLGVPVALTAWQAITGPHGPVFVALVLLFFGAALFSYVGFLELKRKLASGKRSEKITKPDDWRKLETDFQEINAPDYLVVSWYNFSTGGDRWEVRGSPDVATRFAAASRFAGRLLSTSTYCLRHLPRELLSHPKDEERWYRAIQQLTNDFRYEGYATQEDGSTITLGEITNPHKVSATLCYKLASLEEL